MTAWAVTIVYEGIVLEKPKVFTDQITAHAFYADLGNDGGQVGIHEVEVDE